MVIACQDFKFELWSLKVFVCHVTQMVHGEDWAVAWQVPPRPVCDGDSVTQGEKDQMIVRHKRSFPLTVVLPPPARGPGLAREGAGCGSVGDVPGAWLASAPLSPSLWTTNKLYLSNFAAGKGQSFSRMF